MMKFAYVGNDNILHIVKSLDTAVEYSKNNAIIETDIKTDGHGFPVNDNGEGVIVYGPEEMKTRATGDIINPIPELADLYNKCAGNI